MIQCKTMEQKVKNDVSDVPKLQKGTTIASWMDLMIVFLSKVLSSQDIATMSYVMRKEV